MCGSKKEGDGFATLRPFKDKHCHEMQSPASSLPSLLLLLSLLLLSSLLLQDVRALYSGRFGLFGHFGHSKQLSRGAVVVRGAHEDGGMGSNRHKVLGEHGAERPETGDWSGWRLGVRQWTDIQNWRDVSCACNHALEKSGSPALCNLVSIQSLLLSAVITIFSAVNITEKVAFLLEDKHLIVISIFPAKTRFDKATAICAMSLCLCLQIDCLFIIYVVYEQSDGYLSFVCMNNEDLDMPSRSLVGFAILYFTATTINRERIAIIVVEPR